MKYILFLALLLLGCGINGGTHGSIKGYRYNIPKDKLQEGINTVISKSQNIIRDTTTNYYNDGENYLTIKIRKEDVENTYTFRFYGKKEDWDTSKSSEIFIAYAHDKEGNGGSEGDGGLSGQREKLKKELVSIFEGEFINKLDREVGQNHIATD